MRNLWNGRKYFGAKYGRTKDLTGKESSVSFTDIRPGVFPGGPSKKYAFFGLRKFSTKKPLYNGDAQEQTTLNHHRSPLKMVKWIGNVGTGIPNMWLLLTPTLRSRDTAHAQ